MSVDPLIEAVKPPSEWFVVLRPFDGERRFVRGEVVDTTNWTHLNRLVENRYIAQLPYGSKVPEEDSEGVRLIVLDKEQEKQVPAKKRPTPTRKPTKAAN